MSSVIISGDTSGAITLAAPSVAGANTLTLPAQTATLITDSSGILNIGSGQFYKDASGFVGIGTSSPLSRLTTSVSAGSAGAVNNQISMTHNGASTGYYLATIRATGTDEPVGLAFKENATERMRIDSSGNVGIGTSSPASLLAVGTASYNQTSPTAQVNGANKVISNNGGIFSIGSTDAAAADIGGSLGFTANGGVNGYATGQISGRRESATAGNYASYMAFTTSNSGGSVQERMRINSSGQLLVGTTTSNGASLVLSTNSGTTNWNVGPYNSVATNFYITGNNLTNGVLLSGVTATAWSALSDENLKNVTGKYTNPLTDIAKIKPVKFTWKSDDTNKPCVGVIAQSVEQVVPEAIEINELPNSSDKTKYLSVRYTELIPLMIASIQELNAKVTALEAQLGVK
jgi:hypothetical protein